MFLRCIDNCARFIMTTGVYSAFSEWDYSLCPEIRVEIAKTYPTEFIKFTLLIEKNVCCKRSLRRRIFTQRISTS